MAEEEKEKQEIILINEETIQSKIYVVRGQKVMLDFELAEIYGKAEKNLYVIDNYIGVKTLALLKNCKENVEIILFSDNVGNGLHSTEFSDFCKQYPSCKIELKQTGKKYHDRYVIIDYGTEKKKFSIVDHHLRMVV